jgi:hypothetical protein
MLAWVIGGRHDDLVARREPSLHRQREVGDQLRRRRPDHDLAEIVGADQRRRRAYAGADPLAGGLGRRVARPQLHVAGQEVLADALGDAGQRLRSAGVVEEHEAGRERRERGTNQVEVEVEIEHRRAEYASPGGRAPRTWPDPGGTGWALSCDDPGGGAPIRSAAELDRSSSRIARGCRGHGLGDRRSRSASPIPMIAPRAVTIPDAIFTAVLDSPTSA